MYLSIDIGGTKTLLALFSDKGRLMKRLKFPTAKNPNTFIRDLKRNLNDFFPEHHIRTYNLNNIVVAIAATVDSGFSSKDHPRIPTSHTTFGRPIKYGNLDWKTLNFAPEIENCIKYLFKNNRVKCDSIENSTKKLNSVKNYNICPIYIQNDANLAAFYECRDMSGKNIYLTFSTGIGGGIMRNGKLTRTSDIFEPGHRKYTFKGKKLEWEDIASANAIRDAYGVIASEIKGKEALQDIAIRISIGLTDIIKEEKPERIVIGGALGLRLRHFKKYLIPVLAVSLNRSPSELPEIIAAEYPLESVIHGCYLYGNAKD